MSFARMHSLATRVRQSWPVVFLVRIQFAVAYALLAFVCAVALAPHVSNLEIRRVVSGSMEPGISRNDLAFTSPVDPTTLRAGDVILLTAPTQQAATFVSAAGGRNPVLHRITNVVSKDGVTGFETKGDANENGDGWVVPGGNVMGELRFTIPYAGYAFVLLSSPWGYLFGVVAPGLVIMLPELVLILRWILRGEAAFAPAPTRSAP